MGHGRAAPDHAVDPLIQESPSDACLPAQSPAAVPRARLRECLGLPNGYKENRTKRPNSERTTPRQAKNAGRLRGSALGGSEETTTVRQPASPAGVQAARLLATRAFDPEPLPARLCETLPIGNAQAVEAVAVVRRGVGHAAWRPRSAWAVRI